jgi:predicted metal-dependent hydrolase
VSALPWDALARGAALFNQHLFWEAHEAWEELWLELDDEPKLFVQGLIQVAAGYHKATVQRQPRGCVKLLTTALQKLEPSPPDFLGVSTGSFLPAVRRTLAEAERWLAGEVSGVDPALIPRVDLLPPAGPRPARSGK